MDVVDAVVVLVMMIGWKMMNKFETLIIDFTENTNELVQSVISSFSEESKTIFDDKVRCKILIETMSRRFTILYGKSVDEYLLGNYLVGRVFHNIILNKNPENERPINYNLEKWIQSRVRRY